MTNQHSAYIVVTFKLDEKLIPQFFSAGIFSEPEPSSEPLYKHFVAFEARGNTFQEAHDRALETLKTSPVYGLGWLEAHVLRTEKRRGLVRA